jgi:hypothetical protein
LVQPRKVIEAKRMELRESNTGNVEGKRKTDYFGFVEPRANYLNVVFNGGARLGDNTSPILAHNFVHHQKVRIVVFKNIHGPST